MDDGNVSFSIMWKAQYNTTAFCIKKRSTSSFHILQHHEKCCCLTFLRTPVLYSVLIRLLMKTKNESDGWKCFVSCKYFANAVHLIKRFVF